MADVFRLTELLEEGQGTRPFLPAKVRNDMHEFIERLAAEEADLKQLGILDRTKEAIIKELPAIYG